MASSQHAAWAGLLYIGGRMTKGAATSIYNTVPDADTGGSGGDERADRQRSSNNHDTCSWFAEWMLEQDRGIDTLTRRAFLDAGRGTNQYGSEIYSPWSEIISCAANAKQGGVSASVARQTRAYVALLFIGAVLRDKHPRWDFYSHDKVFTNLYRRTPYTPDQQKKLPTVMVAGGRALGKNKPENPETNNRWVARSIQQEFLWLALNWPGRVLAAAMPPAFNKLGDFHPTHLGTWSVLACAYGKEAFTAPQRCYKKKLPAELFGLTEAERKVLRDSIKTRGITVEAMSLVCRMIGDFTHQLDFNVMWADDGTPIMWIEKETSGTKPGAMIVDRGWPTGGDQVYAPTPYRTSKHLRQAAKLGDDEIVTWVKSTGFELSTPAMLDVRLHLRWGDNGYEILGGSDAPAVRELLGEDPTEEEPPPPPPPGDTPRGYDKYEHMVRKWDEADDERRQALYSKWLQRLGL